MFHLISSEEVSGRGPMTMHAPGVCKGIPSRFSLRDIGEYSRLSLRDIGAKIPDLAYGTSATDLSETGRRFHLVRSATSITVVDQPSDLFPDVARNRVQAMNAEPLQCLGRFPAMFIIKAHSAVIIKPKYLGTSERS